MGYFVRVWGELSLTTEQLGAWRETTADPSKWTDWRGELAAPSPAVRVGQRLDAYADWPGGDDEAEFLTIRVRDDRARAARMPCRALGGPASGSAGVRLSLRGQAPRRAKR